jgi:1-acyl-sn-glycerol-3-phosphate acyltransferase
VLVTLLTVAWVSPSVRLALKASWSAALLDALGIEIDADVTEVRPGSLLVANHISWIDIYVINAVLPAAFVSKAEVRDWPLIGWLAAKHDTVFLRRGSRGHARIINEEIAGVLGSGAHVALFPEGTTTDGTHVLHFHGALLQPALNAGRPVQPVALSYWESDGTRSLAPRYDGDVSLGQCLRAVASRPRLVARLVALPTLGLDGADRRVVAQQARAAIVAGAGLAPSLALQADSKIPEFLRSTAQNDEKPAVVAAG